MTREDNDERKQKKERKSVQHEINIRIDRVRRKTNRPKLIVVILVTRDLLALLTAAGVSGDVSMYRERGYTHTNIEELTKNRTSLLAHRYKCIQLHRSSLSTKINHRPETSNFLYPEFKIALF